MSEDAASKPHAYRAKLIAEGRIETSIMLSAMDDGSAAMQVRGLTKTYAVEVWDDGRLVVTLPRQAPS